MKDYIIEIEGQKFIKNSFMIDIVNDENGEFVHSERPEIMSIMTGDIATKIAVGRLLSFPKGFSALIYRKSIVADKKSEMRLWKSVYINEDRNGYSSLSHV